MRIYFDENFSPAFIEGLQRIQEGRPSEGIIVCSVKNEFGQGTRDEIWIPAVASKHGIIITQDINIHRYRAQWQLCQTNKIGIFFIQPPKKGWAYWDIVKLIVYWWTDITKRASETKRPFGFYIKHNGSKIESMQ